jgi:hypothetical protein
MRKPVWLADIGYCDVTMRPRIDRSQSPETGFFHSRSSKLVLGTFHPLSKAKETFL